VAGLASLSAKILSEGTKKDGAIEFARDMDNHALYFKYRCWKRRRFVIHLEGLDSEFTFGVEKIRELLKDPNYTKRGF